jgi:hypothetical protein
MKYKKKSLFLTVTLKTHNGYEKKNSVLGAEGALLAEKDPER